MAHHLHTEIEIDAAPATVWTILTDLAGYADWNPFITASAGKVATGERLVNRLQPPGGKALTFKPTVTEVDEGRAFEWLGRLGLPGLFDGRHRFELVPHGDGTRLIQTESFTGMLVPILRKSLDTGTVAGFRAMNAALKARAEAVAPGGAASTP
jgi:hypothetical protein